MNRFFYHVGWSFFKLWLGFFFISPFEPQLFSLYLFFKFFFRFARRFIWNIVFSPFHSWNQIYADAGDCVCRFVSFNHTHRAQSTFNYFCIVFFLYFHYHWRQGACGIDDFFSFYLFCGPVRCKRRSFCFFTLPFIGTHTQTLWPAGHNFLVIYFYNVGHALRDTEQSFFFYY